MQTILTDIACIHCGYNLRGLTAERLCPECGQAIALSLRGNLLRFSDPEWLSRVRLGAMLLLWNIALAFLGGVTGVYNAARGLGVTFVLTHSNQFIGLLAAFLVTMQEPRISLQESGLTLRKVIRISAVTSVAGALLTYADALAKLTDGLLSVLGAWLGLVGVVSTYLQLIYFRRLAMRIPDEKLALSTKRFLWIAPIAVCLFAIPLLLLPVLTPGRALLPGGMPSPICLALFLGLGLFLWYVLLVVRYHRAFALACTQARAMAALGPSSDAQPDPT